MLQELPTSIGYGFQNIPHGDNYVWSPLPLHVYTRLSHTLVREHFLEDLWSEHLDRKPIVLFDFCQGERTIELVSLVVTHMKSRIVFHLHYCRHRVQGSQQMHVQVGSFWHTFEQFEHGAIF